MTDDKTKRDARDGTVSRAVRTLRSSFSPNTDQH